MKNTAILILSILLSSVCFGQNEISGIYKNHLGEILKLNSDSTFLHSRNIDVSSSSTKGKWKIFKDTIYLETFLTFNISRVKNSNNKTLKDTLVILSVFKKLLLKNDKLYLVQRNKNYTYYIKTD